LSLFWGHMTSSVSSWAIHEQSRLWQALPKCRQAKLFLNTPDKGLARFALSPEKKDLRNLVGLLTDHADLNRHLKIMGLRNEAVCRLCQDEEETSIHFVAQCSAQWYSEDLSSVITRSHWTLLMLSTGQLSWGLQKHVGDFFDHEVCRGCALGPNWGLSTDVPCACAPAPKVR